MSDMLMYGPTALLPDVKSSNVGAIATIELLDRHVRPLPRNTGDHAGWVWGASSRWRP